MALSTPMLPLPGHRVRPPAHFLSGARGRALFEIIPVYDECASAGGVLLDLRKRTYANFLRELTEAFEPDDTIPDKLMPLMLRWLRASL